MTPDNRARPRHYKCKRCGHVFDALPLLRGHHRCPKCGFGATTRLTFAGKTHAHAAKWQRKQERHEAARIQRRDQRCHEGT